MRDGCCVAAYQLQSPNASQRASLSEESMERGAEDYGLHHTTPRLQVTLALIPSSHQNVSRYAYHVDLLDRSTADFSFDVVIECKY
jgi:hypothetical protein